jgi:hypothetical protein
MQLQVITTSIDGVNVFSQGLNLFMEFEPKPGHESVTFSIMRQHLAKMFSVMLYHIDASPEQLAGIHKFVAEAYGERNYQEEEMQALRLMTGGSGSLNGVNLPGVVSRTGSAASHASLMQDANAAATMIIGSPRRAQTEQVPNFTTIAPFGATADIIRAPQAPRARTTNSASTVIRDFFNGNIPMREGLPAVASRAATAQGRIDRIAPPSPRSATTPASSQCQGQYNGHPTPDSVRDARELDELYGSRWPKQ